MSETTSASGFLWSEIEVVFFDAVGTLIHLPRGVAFHYTEVARRHGWELNERMLGEAFRAAWKSMPPRSASGVPRADDDKGWWRELVMQVLDRCEAPGGDRERSAYFEDLYAEFAQPGVWELYPDVASALATLRQRFRLGIISNFDGRLRTILAYLQLANFFDPVVLSSEAGADKPAPEIFQLALTRAGISPAAAVHVGDDPVLDWEGAAAAGLRVFQLERPHRSLAELAEAAFAR